jgi:hypothetical protein
MKLSFICLECFCLFQINKEIEEEKLATKMTLTKMGSAFCNGSSSKSKDKKTTAQVEGAKNTADSAKTEQETAKKEKISPPLEWEERGCESESSFIEPVPVGRKKK